MKLMQEERQIRTYRSEDHVQRHGDVKVERVVVDHADGEEHCHHDHIVSGERNTQNGDRLGNRFHGERSNLSDGVHVGLLPDGNRWFFSPKV